MPIRKDGVDIPVTPGEELMDVYLRECNLFKKVWPQSRESNPEYFVECPIGKVLVEIKDFGEDELFRKTVKGDSSADAYNPFKRIVKLAERSFKQLKSGGGETPCMTILYGEGTPYDRDMCFRDALYGKMTINQMVSADGAMSSEWFGHDGSITADKKLADIALFSRNNATHVSAVAALEIVNPTGALRKIHSSEFWDQHDYNSREEMLQLLEELERQLDAKFGTIDDEFVRLRIYYNHRASKPLPQSAFSGKFDLHTWIENDKLISDGYRVPEYDQMSAFLRKRRQ